MKIGIDLGNVIIGGGGEDTSFFCDNFLQTPPVTGAKLSVQRLARHDKINELHYISKCGKTTEERSMNWLNWHNLLGTTVRPQNAHFVRKRHLKTPMAQALELDIFIDDRLDIIESMENVVKHRILFVTWELTNRELERIFNESS